MGKTTTKAELFQVEGEHTGLLVAIWLDPALAAQLALPGGEPADQLHITLCYCGDANAMSDVQIGRAISAVAEAGMMYGPLSGQLAGIGRFNASESTDGKDVIYANVDVPGLEEVRQSLAGSLEYMAGCQPLQTHGFTPHVTLAYVDEGAAWPIERLPTQPITIRSLWVGVGDRKTEIPLTGGTFKAGARHSRRDTAMLQTMHDHAASLGASCGGKATPPDYGGNALKAVSKTDDELRVANYMVLFGGRDLEGLATRTRNADGSRGEFFTKSTKFDSSYTEVGTLYVDWEHGYYGDQGEPGADDVLGHVDWKSARIDDKGLFVERVLNRRNKYVRYLEELIDDGLIGNSSQAVSDQVQKATNGEILKWPLLRDTLTVAPMEPRMLTANALNALKALSESYPALKSIVETAEQFARPETSTPEAGGNPAADAARKALLELELLELE